SPANFYKILKGRPAVGTPFCTLLRKLHCKRIAMETSGRCPVYSRRIGGRVSSAFEPRRRRGPIRQRSVLRPNREYWCRSALRWVMDLKSVTQLDRQDDLNQFVGNVRRP